MAHMRLVRNSCAARQAPMEKIWMNIMFTFTIVVYAAHHKNDNSFSTQGGKMVAHHSCTLTTKQPCEWVINKGKNYFHEESCLLVCYKIGELRIITVTHLPKVQSSYQPFKLCSLF